MIVQKMDLNKAQFDSSAWGDSVNWIKISIMTDRILDFELQTLHFLFRKYSHEMGQDETSNFAVSCSQW